MLIHTTAGEQEEFLSPPLFCDSFEFCAHVSYISGTLHTTAMRRPLKSNIDRLNGMCCPESVSYLVCLFDSRFWLEVASFCRAMLLLT